MALDPGLYSLDLVRRAGDATVCDWVESASRSQPKALYTRARATRSIDYSAVLYRTLFGPGTPLASVSAPSALAKSKTVQLHDPLAEVELKKQGMTLSSEWRFVYPADGAKLAWKRDQVLASGSGRNSYTCYALRNPDPPTAVAVFKPLTGRERKAVTYDVLVGNNRCEGKGKKEGLLQFEDHNIRRLELSDLRGLEYLLLMSLSSILDADYDDTYKTPADNIYLSFTPAAVHRNTTKHRGRSSLVQPASLNEVAIEEWGQEADYVKHCLWLLRADDDPGPGEEKGQNMTFIVLRAEGERHVAKAIQVAAQVKREFYRLPRRKKGTDEDELHQYIRDTADLVQLQPAPAAPAPRDDDAPGGRPTIRLNDPPPEEKDESRNPFSRLVKGKAKDKEPEKGYQPPQVVSIFLSKEPMPELNPAPRPPRPVSMAVPPLRGGKPVPGPRPVSVSFAPKPASPPSQHPGKSAASLASRPPPPIGAAWNGQSMPPGYVPSGHPAPTGMSELSSRRSGAGKPPPPLPTGHRASPPRSGAAKPETTPAPASKEHGSGRMGRFFTLAKQVRDQPPPGSRS